jgi:FAD/FMN-containing dehydrogenase
MTILVENWCMFAVKSGGHSFISGSSNSIGGVTIDLGQLSVVELLEDGTKAKIGTGATWGNVFAVLEYSGLAVTGGRLSDIGVGGFTLGGGISYLSLKYGLACDNVIEYEVSKL